MLATKRAFFIPRGPGWDVCRQPNTLVVFMHVLRYYFVKACVRVNPILTRVTLQLVNWCVTRVIYPRLVNVWVLMGPMVIC